MHLKFLLIPSLQTLPPLILYRRFSNRGPTDHRQVLLKATSGCSVAWPSLPHLKFISNSLLSSWHGAELWTHISPSYGHMVATWIDCEWEMLLMIPMRLTHFRNSGPQYCEIGGEKKVIIILNINSQPLCVVLTQSERLLVLVTRTKKKHKISLIIWSLYLLCVKCEVHDLRDKLWVRYMFSMPGPY